MLRILSRYTLFELLKLFGLTVAVFTILFLLAFAAKILQQDIPLSNVWFAMPYLVPFLLVFTLPMGLLTAGLLNYARLSATNEILAAQTSGISLMPFLLPGLVLGVIVSGTCFYLQDEVIPHALKRAQNKLIESRARQFLSKIEDGDESEDIPFTQGNRRVFLFKRESPERRRVLVDFIKDGRVQMFTFAENCFIQVDTVKRKIHLRLIDAFVVEYLPKQPFPVFTPVDSVVQSFELKKEQEFRLVSDMRRLSIGQLKANMDKDTTNPQDKKAMEVEIQQRYSMSATGLVFILLAFPLGIVARRTHKLIGFGIAIFIVVGVYYPLAMLGESLAEAGKLNVMMAVWTPNALLAFIGGGLTYYLFRR